MSSLNRDEGDHICTLPTYWMPYVAVGTTYTCPACGRAWFLNEDLKWQSDEIAYGEGDG